MTFKMKERSKPKIQAAANGNPSRNNSRNSREKESPKHKRRSHGKRGNKSVQEESRRHGKGKKEGNETLLA